MQHVAYCYRSGRIRIGVRCLDGTLPIAYGSRYRLRHAVMARSRHAYGKGGYLVPGVPEADDDDAALQAVRMFVTWLTKGLPNITPALDCTTQAS